MDYLAGYFSALNNTTELQEYMFILLHDYSTTWIHYYINTGLH
jgi:hypothetical protein